MKIVFILLLGLLIIIPSAFGVPIAEKTGLKFKFPLNHGEVLSSLREPQILMSNI